MPRAKYKGEVAMPLDTGAVTHSLLAAAGVDMDDSAPSLQAVAEAAPHTGAALRTVRQQRGLSLQDVSDLTRVKKAYLLAIEEMRLEDLPSRPFTIGYVRAYAQALGLDGESMARRFRDDAPEQLEPLAPPVGVNKHRDPRLSLLAGGAAVVVSAVLLWNLAQHAMADDTPPPPVVVDAPAPAATQVAQTGVVTLSAAQPAPQESTLPTPYVTPGLPQAATADGKPGSAPTGAQVIAAANPAPLTFTPHGAIYGAPAEASTVTLQAKKSVSLVVRSPDGAVRFAQQLKAGEAWRAPNDGSLAVDVSDPMAFNVYVGGRLGAGLAAPVTPLSKIGAPTAGA